ncbi:hypothetical protein COHA_001446 [Chlorella ohadii]|uniref:Uncharacterized protein n=1 Tax=Chlorella ohadii TaxID=2649997 RepID=A0AAD5DXX8_9CHLO|nr:hypothetical protein COHA_001446 [Chlorella ohadii]
MKPLGGPCRVSTQWADVNSGIIYTERVQGDVSPLTLLGWYTSKHGTSATEEEWRASILGGQCSINGAVERDPEAPLPPNATVEHRRPGWREPEAPAFLDVLWWDAHVVAVHKPSGLQVLPAGPFHERCALTLLRQFHGEHAAELAGMPAPVHRLGRGTSGVLICACSPEARRKLSRDFVEHGGPNSGCLRKVYRALVQGVMPADEGDVEAPIGRMPYPDVRGGLFAACPPDAPGAKPSRSHYAVLHRNQSAGTTLVDVEIFTGRPHQIRIHMAAAGHPLFGDPLYAPGGLPWPVKLAAGAAAADGAASGQADAAAADGVLPAKPLLLGLLLFPALVVILIVAAVWSVNVDADSNFNWAEARPWPVFRVGRALAARLPLLEARLAPPHAHVLGVAGAFFNSKALHAATKLGVADALRGGPLPIEQLAAAVGAQPDKLQRVLRLLANLGIFREVESGVYANNRASGLLRSDHPLCLAPMVDFNGDDLYFGMTKFDESLKAGHSGRPACEDMMGGLSYWDWIGLPDNKWRQERFDAAMGVVQKLSVPAILQDYPWSRHASCTVMDVGGGLGGILAALLARHTGMQGILFDRPPVIEQARELWPARHPALAERIEFVAGDFFDRCPPADIFFFQHVIHDWRDEPATAILKTIRRAARPTSRLLIADPVMPEQQPVGPDLAALDLQMMAFPGGKDRTAAEWRALLADAGWRLERIVPLRGMDGVVVGAPAST